MTTTTMKVVRSSADAETIQLVGMLASADKLFDSGQIVEAIPEYNTLARKAIGKQLPILRIAAYIKILEHWSLRPNQMHKEDKERYLSDMNKAYRRCDLTHAGPQFLPEWIDEETEMILAKAAEILSPPPSPKPRRPRLETNPRPTKDTSAGAGAQEKDGPRKDSLLTVVTPATRIEPDKDDPAAKTARFIKSLRQGLKETKDKVCSMERMLDRFEKHLDEPDSLFVSDYTDSDIDTRSPAQIRKQSKISKG